MPNGSKLSKVAGPKLPKMPARMPAAPRMPMTGTPNVAGRALRTPRLPSMGRIKP